MRAIHSPHQLWLQDFEESPQLHRLFLAALPTDAAAVALERLTHALRSRHGFHGWPRPTDHFHLTLHGLNEDADVRRDIIEIARAAAAKITRSPFTVTFDRAVSFRSNKGKHPFVLRESGNHAPLHQLYCDLRTALLQAGFRHRPDKKFTPHITLLYDPQSIPERKVAPVRWTVKEFVLVDSLHGRTQYRILDRWPLKG